MMQFKKPQRAEYPQIVKIVNSADQIYRTIYSSQEFQEHGLADISVDSLIQGEQTREYLCAYNERGDIVGYCSFRLKNDQTVWISMLYIDPEYQKQGFGSIFLQKIEEVARRWKALVIVLETDKKAAWTIHFYKKNNYKILSDEDLKIYPFDKVLHKKQVKNRYIFGKEI